MKKNKLERTLQTTLLITNILTIIGYIAEILSKIFDTLTAYKLKEEGIGKVVAPYHKIGDKWYDEFGNEVIPK